MNVPTVSQNPYPTIRRLVLGWERWLRLGQTVRSAPFVLGLALGIGIIIAIASRLRPWLQAYEIVAATAALAFVSLVILALVVWLWPRSLLVSARRFDRLFHLNERTSTALELMGGSLNTNDEFMRRQLDDALLHASAVRPRDQLPLRADWRVWLLPVLLAVILTVLLWLPNPQSENLSSETAREAAIEAAEEALRDITRDVAADPDLNDTDRSQLLEALQSVIDILDQPNVTIEEALAAISSAETTLSQAGQQLQQQATAAQSGLENAASAMQNILPSLQEDGQTAANTLGELIERLGGQVDSLTPAERQNAAQALNAAAQSVESTAPGMAETLREAANSLEQGDMQTAQSQLQEAQQQAEQAAQQAQQAQNSAQRLEQATQRAQQTGAQTSQANTQTANQPGQQGDSSSQGQQGQSSNPSGQPQDSAASGSPQSGQQQNAQQNQNPTGGASGQSGEQGGQAEAQGGQQQNAGDPAQGSSAAGAGDSDNQATAQQSGQGGQQPDQSNNPDGGGERAFEPIYAPIRLGGDPQGEQIELEPDTSQMPVQEGEFAQNPTGRAAVPYNQVFSDYADAANRALESDYVPLGLRDVVRDYFSGLEPGR